MAMSCSVGAHSDEDNVRDSKTEWSGQVEINNK